MPREFLNFLGKDSILDLQYGDRIQEEMTIFFSDIRSYTTFSEMMKPEENFNFINAFLRRAGPVIQRQKGIIVQYFGDGIMALFRQNAAQGSLLAAIDIQKRIASYNEERRQRRRQPIRVGIGLHTGRTVLGVIGDQIRMDTSVVSDTVNTASRIENLTKFYGANILLSQETLNGIAEREKFSFRHLGQVKVKGRTQPIGIFECFDGDPPELGRKKLETLPLFEEGLSHYFDKDFQHSINAFESVLAQNPEDAAALLFLHKARQLDQTDLPEEWTGVEVMGEK